ncbi:MAG: hypothetical protein QGG54_17235, partial [Gammaproteobacteria bacterium]|nr:hypothetical protein [Gammaproteobacteria bacterium]
MSGITLQDQRRLTYSELCQFKWILGNILALVSLWALGYLDVQAEILIALTAIVVLISIGWPALPGRLPRIVWTVIIPLFLTVAIITDFFLTQP